MADVPILCPLKIPENQRFTAVWRGENRSIGQKLVLSWKLEISFKSSLLELCNSLINVCNLQLECNIFQECYYWQERLQIFSNFWLLLNQENCVKIGRIRSYSGLYLVRMRENADQNNSKYGQFSRSGSDFLFLAHLQWLHSRQYKTQWLISVQHLPQTNVFKW